MIKLKNLRRSAVRLLCLVAAILALSQAAGAYQDPRIVGSQYGWTYKDNANAIVISCSANSSKTFEVTNWKGGTFKISAPYDDWGGEHFYSTSSATTLSNNGNPVNLTQSSTGNEMKLPDEATGKNVTFVLTTGNGKTPSTLKASWTSVTVSDGIVGVWPGRTENWTNPQASSSTGSGYIQYDVTPTSNGDIKFRIINGGTVYYPSGSGDIIMNNNQNEWKATQTTSNDKCFRINSAKSGVTYHIRFGTTNKDVNAYWTEGTVGGSDFLIKGLTGSDIKLTSTDNNMYTYKYTPAAGATGNKQIYIYDGSDKRDVGPQSNETVSFSNNNYVSQGCRPNSNKWTLNVEEGSTYEFTYYHEYSKQHRLEIKRTTALADITLPCVPARVTNRRDPAQWNSITSSNPVVYLLANILNGERPSPEWEMISSDEGKTYTLDFTARNSTMVDWRGGNNKYDGQYFVKVYDSKSSAGTEKGRQSLNNIFDWNDIKSYNGANGMLYPGRRYRATYTTSTGTLSLTAIDEEKNYPPFMSIVGYHFRQKDEYQTPISGRKNTNGWQEAWIQFDKDGNVAKDMNGKVMYNTMWPPKYPVYFYVRPQTNGDYVELKSERLQMNPQTTNGIGVEGDKLALTGAEWKELLKDDDNYNNLFDSQTYKSGPGYMNALRDNNRYIRYVATNVWILGTAKIWTGWGGTLTQNGKNLANWSNHANWGIGAHQDSYPDESGQMITKGQPWNLVAQRGNFKFDKPTFFKTVEFFYCVDAPERSNNVDDQKGFYPMYDRCIFYTTEGYGSPEINAKSKNDWTEADYEISVRDVPDGTTVQSYTVTRYDATTDKPCDVNRNQVSADAAIVIEGSNLSLTEDAFNDIAVFNTDDTGKEKTLVNGKYYYELTVVFKKADGSTAKETVTSPIVTIFKGDATAALRAYQLVKILHPESDGYNYLTYDPKGGDKVYKVQVEVNNPNTVVGSTDSYEGVDPANADINPKYVTSEEVADASGIDFGDGSKYRFSCKVLLVGDIVGENITPMLRNVTKASIEGDREDKDNDPTLTDADSRFFYIVEPLIKKNGFEYGYTWKPSFEYTFEDADGATQTKSGTSEASVEGCLVLPEPKLIEEHSRLEMFYGDDDSSNTDNDTRSFSYVNGDNAVELGAGARFQQVRKAIVIERPNVTMRFRALAKDYITSKTPDSGIAEGSTKAPLVVGLFDFKVGDETVVINNGSKYPNSEGLDWYLYHSATKNPADYYFKGYDGFEYGWDPEDNIGVTTYYEPREMTFSVRDAFKDVKFFPRWKDGMISGLRISQDAPVNALSDGTYPDAVDNGASNGDNAVRITRSSLIYAETPVEAEGIKAGDLIESVTVKVNLASETGNVVARVNEEGRPLTEDGKVVETGYEGAGKEMQHTDFITTGNDAQAAAGTATDEKGTTDYFLVRIVDKTTQKDLMTPQAVSAREMYDGKEFAVTANHGHWWDGQLETVKADPLYKRMQVRISHLYPFVAGTKGTTVDTTTPASAPRRAAAEDASDENVVIKSDAKISEFAGNDIPTAVIGVEDAMRDSVVTGVGFIEAHGEGVEIYGADGIKVAAGEGRHEVSAGVYVVRLNGRAEKVIVR